MSTTDYQLTETLALASQVVYQDSASLEGYITVATVNDPDTGFNLQVFQKIGTEEYIFAFRGTEASAQDAYADANLGMNQWLPNREKVFIEINKIASNPEASIHFTGHSLGGALAQYAAYEYAKNEIALPNDYAAASDLVTFNALGGVLGLSSTELYVDGYDATIANTIDAVHYVTAKDFVSRLGNDHVGGNVEALLLAATPLDSHGIANFTGTNGTEGYTADDYASAILRNDYFAIDDAVALSVAISSYKDDGSYSEEEATLRVLAVLATGIAQADSTDLAQLVVAVAGDEQTLGPAKYEFYMAVATSAFEVLQEFKVVEYGATASGLLSLTFANVYQSAVEFWAEHPDAADGVGFTVEAFINVTGSLYTSWSSRWLSDSQSAGTTLETVREYLTTSMEWIAGFSGVESIYGMGTPGNDVIDRTTGDWFPLLGGLDNTLVGFGGNDILKGGEGDDHLEGGDGFDTLYGGEGEDVLYGDKDGDALYGGVGHDELYGGDGQDTLEGGVGMDRLDGGDGLDVYRWNTGDGNDLIIDSDDLFADALFVNNTDISSLSIIKLEGEEKYVIENPAPNGVKYIVLSDDNTLTIYIDNQSDANSYISINNFESGDFGLNLATETPPTPEDPTDVSLLNATFYNRDDVEKNIAINLDLNTKLGIDGLPVYRFDGGNSDDVIVGSDYGHNVYLNAGDDYMISGSAKDYLYGGSGSDILLGGAGNDELYGGVKEVHEFYHYSGYWSVLDWESDVEGDMNTLIGGAGNDFIVGGFFNDVIDGGTGADTVYAGEGSDLVFGGTEDIGNDIIYGDSTWISFSYMGKSEDFDSASGNNDVNGNGYHDAYLLDGKAWIVYHQDITEEYLQAHGEYDEVLEGYKLGSEMSRELSDATQGWSVYGLDLIDGSEVGPDINQYNDIIYAGDGDDTVYGEVGDDVIYGEAGSDYLFGDRANGTYDYASFSDVDPLVKEFFSLGQDNLAAEFHGNDTLYGGAGVDVLVGSAGDDYLDGGTEDDRIYGDDKTIAGDFHGKDTLLGGDGIDRLYGGGNDDIIYGGEGNDIISGDTTTDTSESLTAAYHGNDELWGEGGNDNIFGGGGADKLYGGDGDDTLQGDLNGGADVTIALQYQGDDYLDGGAGIDKLYGYGGDDTLIGGSENDMLSGGDGDDSLIGGSGNDSLYGGVGNDALAGGSGQDYLFGGDGDDTYIIGADETNIDIIDDAAGVSNLVLGTDLSNVYLVAAGSTAYQFATQSTVTVVNGISTRTITAGVQLSTASFNAVSSVTVGGVVYTLAELVGELARAGRTSINTITGNDSSENFTGPNTGFTFNAGGGDDTITGGDGIDRFYGQAGNDVISTGAGADTLSGGTGTDSLSGGGGGDTYEFSRGDGQDTVSDASGIDSLTFLGGILKNDVTFYKDGNNLRVEFAFVDDAQDIIVINNFYSGHAIGSGSIESFVFSDGTISAANVVVANPNRAPVVSNETISAAMNVSNIITFSELLGNDYDPENDPLTITSVSGSNGSYLLDSVNKRITYTPSTGFSGSAQLNYIVSDGALSSAGIATIDVSYVNYAPEASNDLVSTAEDTAKVISFDSLLANDSDVNGQTLTITHVEGNNGNYAIDTVSRIITFTPTVNFNGFAQMTYTASDGELTDSASVNIAVTAVNDAPIVTGEILATSEDTALTISFADLLANDTDVEGVQLSIIAVSGSNGVYVLDQQNKTLTYKPTTDFNGVAQFNYTVSDGLSTAQGEATVNVAAVNDAPIANLNANFQVYQDQTQFIAFSSLFNDAEGDAVIDSITGEGGIYEIDNVNRKISFTPEQGYTGPAAFDYVVSDNDFSVTGHADINVSVVDTDYQWFVTYGGGWVANLSVAEYLLVPDGVGEITNFIGVSNGTYTWDGYWLKYYPANGYEGVTDFTFDYKDASGVISTRNVSLNVVVGVNSKPVAADDYLSGYADPSTGVVTPYQADQIIKVDMNQLLANDIDPEGDPLRILGIEYQQLMNLQYLGTADGLASFKVVGDLTDDISFEYVLSDNVLRADHLYHSRSHSTGTVTLDILPGTGTGTIVTGASKLVAVNDQMVMSDNEPIVFSFADLLSNDFIRNYDGTVSIDDASISIYYASGAGVGVSGTWDGGTITTNYANQTVTITPNEGFIGELNFVYSVKSTITNNYDHGRISIDVIDNEAPIVLGETLASQEDAVRVIAFSELLANDSDVDSNTLTISEISGNNGSYLLDSLNKTITYTPTANFNGVAQLTYKVSDGILESSATATINVAATYDPVVVNGQVHVTGGLEDQKILITFDQLLSNITDVDGSGNYTITDAISYYYGQCRIVETNGVKAVEFTPNENFNGTAQINFTILDRGWNYISAQATIDVATVNDAPAAGFAANVINEVLTSNDEKASAQVIDRSLFAHVADSDFVSADVISLSLHGTHSAPGDKDYYSIYLEAGEKLILDVDNAGVKDPYYDSSWLDIQAPDDSYATGRDGGLVSMGGDGSVTEQYSQTYSGDPYIERTALVSGVYTFSLSQSDWGSAGSYVINLSISNHNYLPQEMQKEFFVDSYQTLSIDNASLLSGIVDGDGDALVISSVVGEHGTYAINSNGGISYVAEVGFDGLASFSYSVSDGVSEIIINANINVSVNDAPVVSNEALSVVEDEVMEISFAALLNNDSDSDGDSLSITSISGDNGTYVLDEVNGKIIYTPSANFNGISSLNYTVSDGVLASTAVATINVSAVNDAPTLKGDESFYTKKSTAVIIKVADLLANDVDVEGNTLSLTQVSGANGTWVMGKNANNEQIITYTPTTGYEGVAGFTYTVSDGQLTSSAAANVFVVSQIVTGTSKNNKMTGSTASDYMNGLAGNDIISGAAGNDILIGGLGDDVIKGEGGNDIITGGAGTDQLNGEAGNDTYIFGVGSQKDVITNTDVSGTDILKINDYMKEDIWLTRGGADGNDLLISMLGTADQVVVDNWYTGSKLDEVDIGNYHLDTNAVEQLVNAMSAFAVPGGAGQALPTSVEDIYQNSLVNPL